MFDADLNFTSDQRLVLRHSWNDVLEQNGTTILSANTTIDRNGQIQYTELQEVLDFDCFMNSKIFYKYTPMSAEDMISFMTEHEDMYVAADYKGKAKAVYEELVRIISDMNAEEVLERIIVNFYSEEDYADIMSVYPFSNVTARQFFSNPHNYYSLAAFCLENNVHVMNLSQCYVEDAGVRILEESGIHVYVAVIDDASLMKEYCDEYGVDGAVTNDLHEDDWEYIALSTP